MFILIVTQAFSFYVTKRKSAIVALVWFAALKFIPWDVRVAFSVIPRRKKGKSKCYFVRK